MASPCASLSEEARHNVPMRLSGFVLGALMPFTLYFSTKSATFFVGIALVLALVGIHIARRWKDLADPLALPDGVIAGLVAAFLLHAAASLLWSVDPETTAFSLGEMVIALVVSFGVALAYRVILPYRFGFGIALGLIAAALFVLVELRLGLKLRGMLGFRNYAFVFNRSVVYQVLLIWPMLLLVDRRSRALAVLAMAMCGLAAFVSESGAAVLGLIIGIACALVASIASRLVPILLAAGTVAYSAVAPFLGALLHSSLPPWLEARLSGAHAVERIAIWRAFGEIVQENPLLGIGLGGSTHALSHPSSQLIDAALRPHLATNHPHNAFLQVWVELGLLGALLLTLLIVVMLFSILQLPRRARIAASGLAGSALAITAVSHGAWQGWWLTTVSVFAAIFWAAREEDHEPC